MAKNKSKISSSVKIIFFGLIVTVTYFFAQSLLMPKYVTDIKEGALIAEFYSEKDKNFDVFFIGDCEVYENFSPVKLWTEYGINSYIRGSAKQTVWQSYYILEDTLRYTKPRLVVFSVLSLIYNEPVDEAYNRMTLDGMRWSKYKIASIRESMNDDEKMIEYIFPLLRYHDRWDELGGEDIKYIFSRPLNSHNGYLMRTDVRPAESIPKGRVLGDYTFGNRAMDYLDRIRKLCEEEKIELLLVKAPSLYPYWYAEYEKQVEAYADKYDLNYINYLELEEDTGIDYLKDTYDAGLHLNLYGAEKLSAVIGKTLRNIYKIPDRSGDLNLNEIWLKKIESYEAEIAAKKAEQ